MRSHAQRNREAILSEATRMFLASGSEVQLEEVARAVGLSRQTIYNLFGSKGGLLEAVAVHLASHTAANLLAFQAEADVRRGLLKLAYSYYDVMLDPRSVQLHRLLIEKAPREPQVVQAIYRRTAGLLDTALTNYLGDQRARGAVAVPDVKLAVEQFLGLIVGPVHLQVTYGLSPDRSRKAQCEAAVDTFLRAFAPVGAERPSKSS